MKTTILNACLAILLMAACRSHPGSEIAGAYVSEGRTEYSVFTDTIMVTPIVAGKTYEVEKRAGFHRIREGKLQPKAYESEKWQADWDESKQLLSEAGVLGRQIYFKPESRQLLIGSLLYRKIK